MRLLASTDIALRVVMLLGRQVNGEQPLKVETIAEKLGGLSRNHLHKIVQDLGAIGIVKTLRGARGGVVLTGKISEVKLGAFIRMLETDQPLVDCFRSDGGSCVLSPDCQLKGKLYEAERSFYECLDRCTLADIIGSSKLPMAQAS